MSIFSPQSLLKRLRQSKVVNRIYYGCHIDYLLFSHGLFGFGRKKLQALDIWLPREQLSDKLIVQEIIRDMNECYKKYKCNASEYFLFDFRNKSDDVRSTYVTDAYINSLLGFIVGRKQHDEQLNDKYGFYCLMKHYFRRKVIMVKGKEDKEAFERFAFNVKRLIVKPLDGCVGSGIIAFDIKSEEDVHEAFSTIISKGSVIVEERIVQCAEMAKWNSSSTNTIRLSAFLTKQAFSVLSCILRTGRAGSVVDNAAAGGISAAIDPKSGTILSEGMDKSGNWYKTHPDSGVSFKGMQIPRWEELLQFAEEIHRKIPNQIYVGWDFALTDDGWVLIEGNWGQLGAQQVALGYGLKPQFDKLLNQGFGI